jgi:uncharacterized protein (DUF362 family)
MGAVYDDFVRTLEASRRRHARDPRREMIELCLLAMEREEIVSVAYREEVILQRLTAMPVPAPVKDFIHHALVWAWKDEEMHAIYVRGTLLRLGSPRLRALTFLRQMGGALGGWASSIRQHVRWSEAPLARACATCVTWAGSMAGQIPSDVRRYLQYGSFRDFCLFNADAERTAWLCWNRLAELATEVPGLPPSLGDDFRRVQADEARHQRVFEILAAALDNEDQLALGETAETLAEKIAEVGPFFLPRSHRTGPAAAHPLGGGGRVWVAAGGAGPEKRPLFRRLLEDASLAGRLQDRARALGKDARELKVVIKPTFMLGYDRRDRSIITDTELLHDLAGFLREHGCADVAVVESANIYDQFVRNRSVDEVARYFGIASPHFRLVDASTEQIPHEYFRGLAQYTVSRTWKEADFRISFPKMRSHPVEIAYLSAGNVEWMGGRCDQFLFVERQAHRETAIMMLLDEFPPHFALVDGYDLAADGLVGVMGCPRPPSPRRLYAGGDALAVDLVAGRHIGLRDPRQSSILRAALHWFGQPAKPVEVVGCDEPIAGWRTPYHNELSAFLSFIAFPVYVLGSGRGALFVPEMDPHAFPPLEPESFFLRASRQAVRRLLGLNLPS